MIESAQWDLTRKLFAIIFEIIVKWHDPLCLCTYLV